jgi:hypothetical protein
MKSRTTVETDKRHTRDWYRATFGVDPLKMGLPYETAPNPYYRRAGVPMKLWRESQVLPHKSTTGIETYNKRSQTGKAAYQARRQRTKEWLVGVVHRNPGMRAKMRELYAIHVRMGELHGMRADCRACHDYDDGCEQCATWGEEQEDLREKRAALFHALEVRTGKDIEAIQLARQWLREDGETGKLFEDPDQLKLQDVLQA